MKKLYLVFGLIFCYSGFIHATIKVWNGSTTSFATPGNWLPGGTAPGINDTILFNGTSVLNCVISLPAKSVNQVFINAGYTGAISIVSGGLNVTNDFVQTTGTFNNGGAVGLNVSGNLLQSGGTFNGLASGITLTGQLAISGGTFNSTSGTIFVSNDLILSGSGVFNNNSGIVTVFVTSNSAISGAFVFNELQTDGPGGATQLNINLGTCTTNILTLDVNGSGDPWAYQGTIDVLNDLILFGTNTTVPTGNSAVIQFSGAGPITVNGSATPGQNKLPNLVFNTTGTIDMFGDISVSGNWTYVDGDLDISNGSTVHFYGSGTTMGDSSRFENLSIETGASITFPGSGSFKVAGDFSNSGTFNPPLTSCMLLNGGAAATQNINGNGFAIGLIEVADGAKTIELNTAVTVLDVLTIGDNVTFDANGGNLTLNAANGGLKARIAPLGTGATIAGSINVQNFIPGGSPGWANLGTPGVDGQFVVDWDGQIPITCTGCTYDSTVITPPFTSVWKWDELTESYQFGLGADPLTPGKGFYVYVASDLITASNYTLVYSGSAVTGNVNVTIDVNPFSLNLFTSNLIANPYASPITWDNVYVSNGSNTELGSIYAWNAQAGAYSVYSPGSGTSGASGFGLNGLIPAGQAFFLDADNSGFGFPFPLIFHETDKVTSNTSEIFKSQNNSNSVKFKLFLHSVDGEEHNTLLHFNTHATENFDNFYDARQIFSTPGYMGYPGSYSKYNSISTQWGGRDYAINTLPELVKTYTVPVLVKVAVSGTHTISAGEFQNFYACMLLHDKLFDTYHNLMQSPYVCQINDTTATPRFEIIICESGITNPNTIQELNASNTIFITQDGNSALVNTRFETETKAEISVYNLLGQKLMNDIQVQGTETSTRLPLDVTNQVVFVKVSTNAEVVTKKLLLGR